MMSMVPVGELEIPRFELLEVQASGNKSFTVSFA